MKMRYQWMYVFMTLQVLFGVFDTQAQLKIGDKIPVDKFEELKRMSSPNMMFKTASEPRLYILDFWSKGCTSCIANFPKMEGLQYQFRDHIKIVTLNPWNSKEEMDRDFVLQQRSQKKKLRRLEEEDRSWKGGYLNYRMTALPFSFNDKSWLELFAIEGVPHIVWLDSTGEILAITGADQVNSRNIEYYLTRGRFPRVLEKGGLGKYDLANYRLVDLMDEEAFPYRDGYLRVGPYFEGHRVWGYDKQDIVDSVKRTVRYSFVNRSIRELYTSVWQSIRRGDWPKRPFYNLDQVVVSESDDTLKVNIVPNNNRVIWDVSVPEFYIGAVVFNEPRIILSENDVWKLRAQYCVEFEIPLNQQEKAPELLLEGLNRFFKKQLGVSATIENRKRYCLVMKKETGFKPLTSDSDTVSKTFDPVTNMEHYMNFPFDHIAFDYVPFRMDHRVGQGWDTRSGGKPKQPMLNPRMPLFDETGLTENVDISLHAVPDTITDPVEAINYRLNGTGLYVEKEIREIEMLIISDGVR